MTIRLKLIKFSIKECWSVSKAFLFLVLLLKVTESLIPLAAAWTLGEIINLVTQSITNKTPLSHQFYIVLSIQVLTLFLSPLLLKIYDYLSFKMSSVIDFKQKQRILNKVVKIPYEEFENPEFHNYLGRVGSSDYGEKIIKPLDEALSMIAALVTVGTLSAYIISFHYILILMALISSIPVYFIWRNLTSKNFQLYKSQTQNNREVNYVTSLLFDKASIKEIKLFQVHDWLIRRYSTFFWKLFSERKKLQKTELFQTTYLDLLKIAIYSSVFLFIISQVGKGSVKVGDIVSIPQAFTSLQAAIAMFFTSVTTLLASKFYLDDLDEFLNIPEMDIPNPQEFSFFREIKIEDLSFCYPNSSQNSLSDINLSIKKNETIAILGENGSGKSTLIKCLTGLYHTHKGEIFYDGIDVNRISREQLFKSISVIFQDFIPYNLSIKENITVSNAFNPFYDKKEKKLQSLIRDTGVEQFAKKLPQYLDTRLGNYLGLGTELSGGQWQKVALSRALYKDSDILILDEPTSALDPKSEIEFFKKLKQMAENKTIIFVTHRTGVAKMADRIIMMNEGRIVEEGSHYELMNNKDLYRDLYTEQQKLYGLG